MIRRVIGISASTLVKDKTRAEVDIYRMNMGELTIKVENDWFERNRLYALSIDAPMSAAHTMRFYFRPDTLEEDTEAEERWKTAE